MTAPTCDGCGVELAPRVNVTRVQAEQGEWWDHPPVPGGLLYGHTGTVLVPSKELAAFLDTQTREAVDTTRE